MKRYRDGQFDCSNKHVKETAIDREEKRMRGPDCDHQLTGKDGARKPDIVKSHVGWERFAFEMVASVNYDPQVNLLWINMLMTGYSSES